ncbi:FMN-dependent dehydrogenase domain-containing protein [Trichoderma aethiopicum]
MARKITTREILQHNKLDDVWIVVDGEVYDMTVFAPEHPGGAEIILKFAAKDATEEYGRVHSPSLIRETLGAKGHVGTLDTSTITEEWRTANQSSEQSTLAGTRWKPALDELFNMDDFEKAAQLTLSKKSWAYIKGGSNDNITRDANSSMLRKIWLRPKVLRNVGSVTARTTLFGCDLEMPVFISPTGAAKAGGAEGELTLARGAGAAGIVHCFATPSSYTHLEVLQETKRHAFFQLYVNKDRSKSEAIVRTIEATGKVKAILVTVDVPVIPKREDDERVKSNEQLQIAGIGLTSEAVKGAVKGDKRGAGLARQVSSFIDPTFTWDDLEWLRSITEIPIVIKGIQCAADAIMAARMGAQGIVISNHGGRGADTAPPSILVLLELQKQCPEIFGQLEILIDGGFRRGSDIVKAVCLGASAVGLGRPFLYSLGYGQEGVERVAWILKDEIETAMRLCGMADLMRDAHPDFVNTSSLDFMVPGLKHPYARKVNKTNGWLTSLRSKL